MKKIALMLSLIGLSSVAIAQSNVTIYGKVDAGFENARGSGTENRVNSNDSYIGFRGEEVLGNGLKAVWQIESGVAMDGVDTKGLATRNNKIGLQSKYGEVFLGQYDTPFKNVGVQFDTFQNMNNASVLGIMGKTPVIGSTIGTSEYDNFNLRSKNTLGYISPSFYGVKVALSHGASEQDVGKSVWGPLWSTSVGYENGNFTIAGAYERHDLDDTSTAGSNANARSQAWRLGTSYVVDSAYGKTKLNAMWETIDTEDRSNFAKQDEYRRNAWTLGAQHRLNAHEFGLAYAQAADGSGMSSANNFGAKQWSAGYRYHFSKRTSAYTYYTQINNEGGVQYNFTPNATQGGINGTDSKAYGLGLTHFF